jgi:hypothetical protein
MSALVIFGGFGGVCPLVDIRFYPGSVELGLSGSVVFGQTSVIQSPKLAATNSPIMNGLPSSPCYRTSRAAFLG